MIQIMDLYSGRGFLICTALHMPFSDQFNIFFMILDEGIIDQVTLDWK